jgi:hypothetical protein
VNVDINLEYLRVIHSGFYILGKTHAHIYMRAGNLCMWIQFGRNARYLSINITAVEYHGTRVYGWDSVPLSSVTGPIFIVVAFLFLFSYWSYKFSMPAISSCVSMFCDGEERVLLISYRLTLNGPS